MATNITEADYRTANQKIRGLKCKVNLLNSNYQTVDSFSGVVVDGNVSCNADSDIRRTLSLSLILDNPEDEIKKGGKLWLDKYVKVFMGIDNILTGEVNWTNVGIYIINDPSIQYDNNSKTVNLSCVDLMAKLTGLRNGNIQGIPITIPVGSNVREVVIGILKNFTQFTKYIIEDSGQLTPYEVSIEKTGTIYDMFTSLRDITPNWEFFFDVEGVFHWQEIPNGSDENISIDSSLLKNVIVSRKTDYSFSDIKNSIIVYGKTHDPSYYIDSVEVFNGKYYGEIDSITEIPAPYTTISFYIEEILENPYIVINNHMAIKIQNEDGSFASFDSENTYYVIRMIDDTHALLLGHQQAYGEAKDTNPESPFYINSNIGEIVKVFSGGDYDNIYTDDLARQRAEYELYLYCKLNDSISFSCVPIYWLDVNMILEYDVDNDGNYDKYIVKSFSYGLGISSEMSVTAVRYYPAYNF